MSRRSGWRRLPFGLRFAGIMMALVVLVAAVPLEVAGRQAVTSAGDTATTGTAAAADSVTAERAALRSYAQSITVQLRPLAVGARAHQLEADSTAAPAADVLMLFGAGGSPSAVVQSGVSQLPVSTAWTAVIAAARSGATITRGPTGGALLLAGAAVGDGSLVVIGAALPSASVDGVVLVNDGHTVSASRLIGAGATADASLSPALAAIVSTGGTGQITVDGSVVVASAVHIGGGYSLVAAVQVSAFPVLDPPGLVLVALAVIGMVIVVLVVQNDLQRPLRRLDRAVTALAVEDFSVPLPAGRDDEIGRLSRSFEDMRGRLAEALLESRARAAMASALNAAGGPTDGLEEGCRALCETSGIEAAMILVAANDGASAFAVAAGQAAPDSIDDMLAGGGPFGLGFRSPAGTVMCLGAVPPCLEAEQGLRELCVAPVHLRGEPIAVVGLIGGVVATSLTQERAATLMAAVLEPVALALERHRITALIERQATTDELTGSRNRRFLMDHMGQQLALAERQGDELSLLMFDLDHFKRLNDTYGHQTGDLALQSFARTVAETTRRSDIVARYGGEEFVALMPNTGAMDAVLVAEKIRRAVAELRIQPTGGGDPVSFSVSIGIASYPNDATDGESLLRLADLALYRAKDGGRNQVALARDMADIERLGTARASNSKNQKKKGGAPA